MSGGKDPGSPVLLISTGMSNDTAFEMAVSSVRFGVGVTREVGMDLKEMGAGLVLVVTDPVVSRLPPVQTVLESLEQNGVPFALYDRVRVEPTDESFLDAIAFARARPFDAFVAVGGGSTIDTAKAVNLYTTYPPADFLDYVNPPIGKGLPVPGPLKPLMAIPTTAGTGSETTGVTIFDLQRMHAKTGIANRRLKPTLGYLDPENTRTMPPQVAASSGPRHPEPRGRVVHGDAVHRTAAAGASRAAAGVPGIEPDQRRLVAAGAADGRAVPRARGRRSVRRRGAREHAAGGVVRRRRVRERGRAPAARHVVSGVGAREELSRAGVRGGSSARAARHLRDPQCAGRLPLHRARQSRPSPAGGRGARGRCLARARGGRRAGFSRTGSRGSCSGCNTPNGLRAIGYSSSDIPALVEGTLPQHRVTKLSPRPAGPDELSALFEDAMVAW